MHRIYTGYPQFSPAALPAAPRRRVAARHTASQAGAHVTTATQSRLKHSKPGPRPRCGAAGQPCHAAGPRRSSLAAGQSVIRTAARLYSRAGPQRSCIAGRLTLCTTAPQPGQGTGQTAPPAWPQAPQVHPYIRRAGPQQGRA